MFAKSECPNCGAVWGIGSEEWDWQQCDCCGYPDNDADDKEFDDDDFFYDSIETNKTNGND